MHSDLEPVVRSAIQYPDNPELCLPLAVLHAQQVAAPQNRGHSTQQCATPAQVGRHSTLREGFRGRILARNLHSQFYPNTRLLSTFAHFRPQWLTSADRDST